MESSSSTGRRTLRQRSALQPRTPQVRYAGSVQFLRRQFEALRLARHQHQENALQLPEGVDHHIVFVDRFVGHGAGRDPDSGRARALDHLRDRRRGVHFARLEIVLEVPADRDAERPDRQEAARHLLALRQYCIDGGEHHREDPPQAQISRQRLVGDASIDNRETRAGAVDLSEEVGPDLGLRHHHQRGLEGAQHAPHYEDVVHRSEEDSIGERAQFRFRCGAPGQRRGGDDRAWSAEIRRAGRARIPGRPESRPSKLRATRWLPDRSVYKMGAGIRTARASCASRNGPSGSAEGNTIGVRVARTPEGPGRGNRCLLFSKTWLFS